MKKFPLPTIPFSESWKAHPTNANYEVYAVHDSAIEAFVRSEALPQGFLWQCKKRYGFAATLAEAKAWAEALALHYSLPKAKRWMTL